MKLRPASLLATITLAAIALACAAPAQCLFTTVTTQQVGPGCNTGHTGCCAIVASPAQLTLELDTTSCQLDAGISAIEGCCGVIVPFRFLALGLQANPIPLPEFGPACTLHLDPIVLLGTTGASFTLDLPPGVPTLTFLAQGAAWSQWSFGSVPDVITFSSALLITLQ